MAPEVTVWRLTSRSTRTLLGGRAARPSSRRLAWYVRALVNTLYVALSLAIVAAIMQAGLDKAGVGRVEAMAPSATSAVLVALSVPITFLSNLGAIAVTVWSFFVLPWLPTLIVVLAAVVGFSLVWGTLVAILRRSPSWESVVSAGVPLVFALRMLCAACVVYLAFRYARGQAL
jgi:hypothetical protein